MKRLTMTSAALVASALMLLLSVAPAAASSTSDAAVSKVVHSYVADLGTSMTSPSALNTALGFVDATSAPNIKASQELERQAIRKLFSLAGDSIQSVDSSPMGSTVQQVGPNLYTVITGVWNWVTWTSASGERHSGFAVDHTFTVRVLPTGAAVITGDKFDDSFDGISSSDLNASQQHLASLEVYHSSGTAGTTMTSNLATTSVSFPYAGAVAADYADTYVCHFSGDVCGGTGTPGGMDGNNYPQYYNPEYFNYNPVGGDCANFASQALSAGGVPQTTAWHYYITNPPQQSDGSGDWVGALALWNYMTDNGYATEIPATDVQNYGVLVDDMAVGGNHVEIVDYIDPGTGTIYIDCHNADAFEFPASWYNSNESEFAQPN